MDEAMCMDIDAVVVDDDDDDEEVVLIDRDPIRDYLNRKLMMVKGRLKELRTIANEDEGRLKSEYVKMIGKVEEDVEVVEEEPLVIGEMWKKTFDGSFIVGLKLINRSR